MELVFSRRWLVGCGRAAALLAFVFAVLLVPVAGRAAHADGVGISPVSIDFPDALRGGTFAGSLTLTNAGSKTDTEFSLTAVGDIAPWVAIVPVSGGDPITKVLVPSDQSVQVAVRVTVPETTANGAYTGAIEVQSAQVGEVKPGNGTSVQIGGLVELTVAVNGTQRREAKVNDMYVDPAEVGMPQRFNAVVQNLGNVLVQPLLTVTIQRDGQQVASLTSEGRSNPVLPAGNGIEFIDWDTSEAAVGDYTAQFSVSDTAGAQPIELATESVAFRVEQLGTYTRSGTLDSVRLLGQPALDQLAQVQGTFTNTGKIASNAVLSLEVYLDGRLVDSIQSLPRAVRPGETAPVVVAIKTPSMGQYRLVGTVNFDGSVTDPVEINFRLGTADNGNQTLLLIGGGGMALALVGFAWRRSRSRRGQGQSADRRTTTKVDDRTSV